MPHAARTTLAVTLFGFGLIASAAVGACSGGEFSADAADAGSGGSGPDAGSGAGTSAAGSTSGGTVLCRAPEECDDADPCTLDECSAEGTCVHSAKCGAGEKCCDGDCGQCCVQEDCNDSVSCTADQCFNFFCAFVPDDGECGTTQYCHREDDCKDREQCPSGTLAECDDGDPCTTESCNAGLCYHDDCASGQHCCANGCAECCDDGECGAQAGDACSVGKCEQGQCQTRALCSDSEMCCAATGTATCAECCAPEDCSDDGVLCTEPSCLGGACSHVPNDGLCGSAEVCDPEQGCIPAGGCQEDGDCLSPDPCSKGTCAQGTCTYSELCPGQQCCGGICQDCCSREDCSNIASSFAGPIPPDGCESVSCVNGSCLTAYLLCTELCCAPYGCCSLDM